MKKLMIGLGRQDVNQQSNFPLMEQIASLGVTSEASGFPIESALGLVEGPGWRAAELGEQLIRIVFGEPQNIRRIELEFREANLDRTQEFVLRWATKEGQALIDVRRQRWNFSPDGSTTETEDYSLNLEGVGVLELLIQPDLGAKIGVASLTRYRVS